jgi:HD-GYP domain-containing protein (c-di-GMP phosphodiesterase class II)
MTTLACHIFPDEDSRKHWHTHIVEERTQRIDEYRKRTVGPDSLWSIWRTGLPQGKQIQDTATRRMKLWASALDPDFAHSERVARFALGLYDGLNAAGLLGAVNISLNGNASDVRASLYVAALLHDVGKSQGNKGHQKTWRAPRS